MASPNDLRKLIGRAPESFTYREARAAAGHWIALERYSPATCPLKRIEAIDDSPAGCLRQLTERNLDPREFEILSLQ